MAEREKKVMILDNASRGFATAKHLREFSPEVGNIYLAPGNGGTGLIEGASNIALNPMDNKEVVEAARDHNVDLVIICPEEPLANGVVDALTEVGVLAFGPTKAAAQLESSKAYAMELLKENGIPHPAFVVCETEEEAHNFLNNPPAHALNGLAIKADDLRGGKGVIVVSTLEEAHHAVELLMGGEKFGEKVKKIVIQEKLHGVEVSAQSFVDGKNDITLPFGEDHKQVYAGDKGEMTGGMGVRMPHPLVTVEVAEEIESTIIKPLVSAMNKRGIHASGLLYPAIFLTEDGRKVVIETNFRPGGPEWETLLRLLQSNLYQVLTAAAKGNLEGQEPKFSNKHAVSVVLGSKGYPGKYEKGKRILGLDTTHDETVQIAHAGTRLREDGAYETWGGRVLLVSATGDTFDEAYTNAYGAVDKISFENSEMEVRRDIGKRRND